MTIPQKEYEQFWESAGEDESLVEPHSLPISIPIPLAKLSNLALLPTLAVLPALFPLALRAGVSAVVSLVLAIFPRLLAFAVPGVVDLVLRVDAGLDPEVGGDHAAYHREGGRHRRRELRSRVEDIGIVHERVEQHRDKITVIAPTAYLTSRKP